LTLLDVILAVHEVAANEQETLATVVHQLTSGQVWLSDDAIRAMRDHWETVGAVAMVVGSMSWTGMVKLIAMSTYTAEVLQATL
jgi:hypothetical protein